MKYLLMESALHQKRYIRKLLYTVIPIVDWVTSRDRFSWLLLSVLILAPLLSEASMNDEVSKKIIEAENKLQAFIVDPKGSDTNFLLGSVLNDVDDIKIKPSGLHYKRIRLSLLMLHLNVLHEFDKYYIQNYYPERKYFLNLIPPSGAVDGPIFGAIDPAEINDEKVRSAYKKDLDENAKLGKEIALQSELSALKFRLSMYNNDLGVISDSLHFIKQHYTNNATEQTEVARAINSIFHGSERGKQLLKSLYEIK